MPILSGANESHSALLKYRIPSLWEGSQETNNPFKNEYFKMKTIS